MLHSLDHSEMFTELYREEKREEGDRDDQEDKSESEVVQSCLTLCNPMDCSLPSSSVHGIFQAIVLEWIAISFSREIIFPTQGSNLGLPHCRETLYRLSHQGNSLILILIKQVHSASLIYSVKISLRFFSFSWRYS